MASRFQSLMMQKVRIYTTPICSFCVRAKNLLKKKGTEFQEIDVFMDDQARQDMLRQSGGARTVPQIFIGATHVGGYEELHALEIAGRLDTLLATE